MVLLVTLFTPLRNAGQFSRFDPTCIRPKKTHVFTRESAPLGNWPCYTFFPRLGFLEMAFTLLGLVFSMLAPPTTFICWIISSCAQQISSVFCSGIFFSRSNLSGTFETWIPKTTCPVKFDLPKWSQTRIDPLIVVRLSHNDHTILPLLAV